MNRKSVPYCLLLLIVAWIFLNSCNNTDAPGNPDMVSSPELMDKKNAEHIKLALANALLNDGRPDDSIRLEMVVVVDKFYKNSGYKPIWSTRAQAFTTTVGADCSSFPAATKTRPSGSCRASTRDLATTLSPPSAHVPRQGS